MSDARVAALQQLRFGMFICWSFSTFSGREWTGGVQDVSFFRATEADTDQWVRTARDAGMGYLLFLTKHHDGFCLWDTQTTARKVTKAPLGRDVLAELRRSCDRHGVKLALYYSEGDWTWPGAVDGKSRLEGIGRNPEMKKAQLRELLTQYGPIEYIWFDHAVGDGGLSHTDTIAFCKALQPDCFVGFNNGPQDGADIRLGERGRPGPLDDHLAARPQVTDPPAKSYRIAEFTYPFLPRHEGGALWFYGQIPGAGGALEGAASSPPDARQCARSGDEDVAAPPSRRSSNCRRIRPTGWLEIPRFQVLIFDFKFSKIVSGVDDRY